MNEQETCGAEEKTDKSVLAEEIIRKRVYAAVGAGLVPVPIFDLIALSGIQIEMVAKLARLYETPFRKDVAKTAVTALAGSVLPLAAAFPLSSFLKALPVIGTTTGAVSMSATGGAATFAVGKVFVRHFESGGTLLSFDPKKAEAYYREKFKEGKERGDSAEAKF